MDSPILTVDQAAAMLGIKPAQCRRWLAAGIVPHHKNGSRIIIHRAELEQWMRAGQQSPQPTAPAANPTSQTVSINANGLTLEISISIKADEGRQLRPVVSIR